MNKEKNDIVADLQTRVLSSVTWSGVSHFIRQILQFGISIALARLLSPREFGLIGMILIFSGFGNLILDLGFGAALIQKYRLTEQHIQSLFVLNIVTGIVLAGMMFFGAPLVAALYSEPMLKPLTKVLSINFLISSLVIIPSSLMQKEMHFNYLAKIEISSTLGAGIVAISLVLSGFGVWSLVSQIITLSCITTILIYKISDWKPGLSWDSAAVKDLIKYSSNLLGFNLVNYWARNSDNLLIGKYVGSDGLGIYTRAYSLMLLPLSQVASIISRVFFPAISSIQHDILRVKKIFLQLIRVVALFTFPMMIGIIVTARPMILAIFGAKWELAIPVIQILCLAGIEDSVSTYTGLLYNSMGRTDLQFRWGLCASIIRIIAFIIGLRWGILGVAWAYVISGYLFLWYPSWIIPGRLIQLNFIEVLRNLKGPFLCASFMGLILFFINRSLPSSASMTMILVLQIIIGVTIYILLISLFNITALKDVKRLLKGYRSLNSTLS